MFLILFLFGCAVQSTNIRTEIPPIKIDTSYYFYHRVERKETLYSISRNYSIDLDEVVRLNKIEDPSKIIIGQMLIIPKLAKDKTILDYSDKEEFLWPIKYTSIISKSNKGIDIKAPLNYNICAARSGIVSFYKDNFNNYGNTLIIKHNDNYSTVYCGFSEKLVELGDKVCQGQTIAKNSGVLHFEIRRGYKSQNPYYYLAK